MTQDIRELALIVHRRYRHKGYIQTFGPVFDKEPFEIREAVRARLASCIEQVEDKRAPPVTPPSEKGFHPRGIELCYDPSRRRAEYWVRSARSNGRRHLTKPAKGRTNDNGGKA